MNKKLYYKWLLPDGYYHWIKEGRNTMISCIITGHGEFPVGMLHALEMIAGPQEKMVAIPFRESAPLEEYQKEIYDMMTEMLKESDKLIVLTDLLGGTPFNTSMLFKGDRETISVITGTNLPMLLELVMQRLMDNDIDEVLERLIHSAQTGATIGEIKESDDIVEEDGI